MSAFIFRYPVLECILYYLSFTYLYSHKFFGIFEPINVTISDGFTSRSGKCKFSYFDYTVKFKTCTTAYTTIIEETKSYIIYLFIFILFIDSLALDNYVVVVLFVKFVV